MAKHEQFKLSTGQWGDVDDNRERTSKTPKTYPKAEFGEFHMIIQRSSQGLLPVLTSPRPQAMPLLCAFCQSSGLSCLRSEAGGSVSKSFRHESRRASSSFGFQATPPEWFGELTTYFESAGSHGTEQRCPCSRSRPSRHQPGPELGRFRPRRRWRCERFRGGHGNGRETQGREQRCCDRWCPVQTSP